MMRRAGLILAVCAALAAAAPPAPGEVTSLRGWKSLTLKAQASPLYTGSATLEISEARHAHTGRDAIVLEARSEASLLGAIGFSEKATSWIDASARRPLELLQIRPGDSARRWRFEPEGIRQTSWKPPEGRPDAPLEQWRETETTLRRPAFEDGTPVPGEAILVDPYALLYLLRDLDLSSPHAAPREFVLLQRRQAVRVMVTPAERRVQSRQITDESAGRPILARLAERRLALKGAEGSGGRVRGPLGMEGEMEIWMEESGGALLEIRGNAPGVGPTTLALASYRR